MYGKLKKALCIDTLRMRKALAFAVCLFMLVGMLPVGVYAESPGDVAAGTAGQGQSAPPEGVAPGTDTGIIDAGKTGENLGSQTAPELPGGAEAVKPETPGTTGDGGTEAVKPEEPGTTGDGGTEAVKPEEPGTTGDGGTEAVKPEEPGTTGDGGTEAVKPETPGTTGDGGTEAVKPETPGTAPEGQTDVTENPAVTDLVTAVLDNVAKLRKNGASADWRPDFIDAKGVETANKVYFDKAWKSYLQLTEEAKTGIPQKDRDFLELCSRTVFGKDDYCKVCWEHGIKAYHDESACPYNPENVAVMDKLIDDESQLQSQMDAQPEQPVSFFGKFINKLWDTYSVLVDKVKDIFSIHGHSEEEAKIIAHREALLAELNAAQTISADAESLKEAVRLMKNTDAYVAENGPYIDQVWEQYNAMSKQDNLADYVMFTFENWDTASESEPPVFSQEWQTLVDVYRAHKIAEGCGCRDCKECLGIDVYHINEAGLTEECPNAHTLDSLPGVLKAPEKKTEDGASNVSSADQKGEGGWLSGLLNLTAAKAYGAEPNGTQAVDDTQAPDGTQTVDGTQASDGSSQKVINTLPSFFSNALKAASVNYLPGLVTSPDRTARTAQTIGAKNGEPYKLIVDPNGRISVWYDVSGKGRYDQKQYYGSNANSNGSVLVINGKAYGTSYLGSGLRDNNGYYAMSNQLTDNGRTVKTVFVNKSGVQVTQFINLPQGANYINKRWEIKNYNSTSVDDLRFIHGGDTFFAGSDFGKCYYNRGTRSVYIKKDASSGMMSYIWDGATPADRYFSGNYSRGWELAYDGLLNNYASHTANPNAESIDASYYLQWNKASLKSGDTWTIKATEGFSLSGDVQIQAPAENTAAPGSLVSYRFTLMNMSAADQTVTLSASSSNHYSADIREINGVKKESGGYTATVPAAGSKTVIVDCEIPESAPNGTDKITLKAKYGQKTQTGSVTTTINSENIGFDRVVVVENTSDPSGSGDTVSAETTIYAEINGKNLPTNAKITLVAKLMQEDGTPTNIVGKTTVTTGKDKVDQVIGIIPLHYTVKKGVVYYAEVSIEKIVLYGDKVPGTGQGTEVPPGTITDTPSGPVTIEPEIQVKAVKSISFTNSEIKDNKIKLYKGESIQLNALVAPADASNQELEWSSSDYGAATVNANGLVMATGSTGTARIMATAQDHSGATGEVTIQVIEKPERITFQTKDITLAKGDTVELKADVYSENYTLGPDDIQLSIKGNGGAYVKVKTTPAIIGNTATFTVTALANTPQGGPVSIKALIDVPGDNPFIISDTAKVRVVGALPTGIQITSGEAISANVVGDEIKTGPGQTITLGALISPADAADSMTAGDVVWSTDRTDLVTFAKNPDQPLGTVIKANGNTTGKATVRVRINGYNYEDAFTVNVSKDVERILVYPASKKVGQGELMLLAVDYLPVYADPPTASWEVSGPALLEKDGGNTRLRVRQDAAPGDRIEVKANIGKGITASAVYTVEARVSGLTVTGSAVLNIGQKRVRYQVSFQPEGLADDQKKIKWDYDKTKLELVEGTVSSTAVTFNVVTSAAAGSTPIKVISTVNKDIYGLVSVNLIKAPFLYNIEKASGGGIAATAGGFYTDPLKITTTGMKTIRAEIQKVEGSMLTTIVEEQDFTPEQLASQTLGDGSWRISIISGERNDGVITGATTFTLKVDTKAPVLSDLTVTGAGATLNGGRVETTGTLNVSVTATDSASGVAAVRYSINNGEWNNMLQMGDTDTWKADIQKEFAGIIRVQAEDKAGYKSDVKSQKAMITSGAKAPALVDKDGKPIDETTWNKADVEVIVTGGAFKDGGLSYTLTNPADKRTATQPAPVTSAGGIYSVTISQEGVTKLIVTAEDVSGGTDTASALVRIDRTVPTLSGLTVTGAGATLNGGRVETTGTLNVSVKATDSASGVADVSYSIDGGKNWNKMTQNSGTDTWKADIADKFIGTIQVKAKDKAGYESEELTQKAMITGGVEAPTLALVDKDGKPTAETTWNKDDVKVIVTGGAFKDGGLTYTLTNPADKGTEGKSTPVTSTGGIYSVTISQEGVTKIIVTAEDVSGHKATASALVRIDKTVPVLSDLTVTGAGATINGDRVETTGTLNVSVKATDSASEVAAVRYSIDGGKTWNKMVQNSGTDTWKADIADKFIGTIRVQAEDKAGYESDVKSQNAMITGGVEAPTLALADKDGKPTAETTWNKDDVKVIVTGGAFKDGGLTYTLTNPADKGTEGKSTPVTSTGGIYSVTISQEGVTKIIVTAEDVSGHKATASALVRIDRTAPSIKDFLVTGGAVRVENNKVYAAGPLTISATISDEDSKVDKVIGRVTSGTGVNTEVLMEAPVTGSGGQYTFTYSKSFDGAVWFDVTDVAGNTAQVSGAAMIADAVQTPVITLTDETGTGITTAGAWTKGDVKVKVSGHGTQKLTYRLEGAASSAEKDFPLEGLDLTETGVTTVTAIATDISGAKAETKAVVMIDNNKPAIGKVELGGKDGIVSGGAYYLNNPMTVTASAVTDGESGVGTVTYNLVTKGVTVASQQAMTLGDNGWTAVCTKDFDGWIEICAVDKVGNTQVTSKAAVLFMDWVLNPPLTQEKVDGVFGPGAAVLTTGAGVTATVTLQKDVTLTGDKTIKIGTDLILDLNGHTITGADGTEGKDGHGAITIVEDNVKLDIVNSGGSAGSVNGGNGGAGTSGSPNGGNGGPAVDAGTHSNCQIAVGGNVTVSGGDGGKGDQSANGNGGNGGNGIVSQGNANITVKKPARVDGGDGGTGAGTGNGGQGADGVVSQSGNVTVEGGNVTGGNGGQSGTSGATGGSGGNGCGTVEGDITVSGGGSAVGGSGGEGGTSGGSGGNGCDSAKGDITVSGGGSVVGGSGGDGSQTGGAGGAGAQTSAGSGGSGGSVTVTGGSAAGGSGGAGTESGGAGGAGVVTDTGNITVGQGGSTQGGSGGSHMGGSGDKETVTGGAGGAGTDSNSGSTIIENGGTSSGGSGGAGTTAGGSGGAGTNTDTGKIDVSQGGSTVGGSGGDGTNSSSGNGGAGGSGGAGMNSESGEIVLNGSAAGGTGGAGTGSENGSGGAGGSGVHGNGNITIGGDGSSAGGNGGNVPGGESTGKPGAGGGAIEGGESSTIKQETGSEGFKVTTTINTEGATVFAPAGDLANAAVSDEDKDSGSGLSVEVVLSVVESSEKKPDCGSVEKETVYGSSVGDTVGEYFDIVLKKIVTDSQGKKVETIIRNTQADAEIEMTISIPVSMRGGSNYSVVRVHDGKAETLPTKQVGDKLVFRTNRFSTYAIVYTQAPSAVKQVLTLEEGGTGSTVSGKSYAAGSLVRVNAGTKDGFAFDGWTVSAGAVTLTDKTSSDTYFTMPDESVILTAAWRSTSSSGGHGHGGGDGGGDVQTPPAENDRISVDKATGGQTQIKTNSDGSSTVTITPDNGFVVKEVWIDGKNVGPVEKYTFPAGSSKHTVKVVFEKKGTEGFADISGHWAEKYIRFVYDQGLMSGTGSNTFDPETFMSRGMTVTVLYKMAGSPELSEAAGKGFVDVPKDAYYAKAAAWAQSVGVVAGYKNGSFKPQNNVTRQEFAQILCNYANAMKLQPFAGQDSTSPAAVTTQTLNGFTDMNDVAAWALPAMEAMVSSGVMNGTPDKKLQPENNILRAEAASMLYNFVNLQKTKK